MTGEWFRSPAWDESARADFEVRLSRARPHNRQQYLLIKALALRDHVEFVSMLPTSGGAKMGKLALRAERQG
ncbi:MAG: hypothetical protein ACLQFR_05360 [Streptosporangiaceae bacterium]